MPKEAAAPILVLVLPCTLHGGYWGREMDPWDKRTSIEGVEGFKNWPAQHIRCTIGAWGMSLQSSPASAVFDNLVVIKHADIQRCRCEGLLQSSRILYFHNITLCMRNTRNAVGPVSKWLLLSNDG